MEYHQNGAPTLIQIPLLIPSLIDPSYPLASFDFQKNVRAKSNKFCSPRVKSRSVPFRLPRGRRRERRNDITAVIYAEVSPRLDTFLSRDLSKPAHCQPRQTRGARVKIHEA